MNRDFDNKTALVTGANSGLGFEAAAQLAEAGYAQVVLACRTTEKGEAARQELIARVGSDPFETVGIDVSSIDSAEAASAELVRRGVRVDVLLLNAGMLPGATMVKTVDDLEVAFATSIIGHHVMTLRLLHADGLAASARVVIAGSEAANNAMPAFVGMKLYDFATGPPAEFADNLHDAMLAFARGSKPELYSAARYYATAKLFTSWWSAAMARRFGDRVSVFAVSPGANAGTRVTRHLTGFNRLLMTRIMPAIGPALGMYQPISAGARRYLDVLHDVGREYVSGKTYTSRPGKAVGPLWEVSYPHISNVERQEAAWAVLEQLTTRATTSS